MKIFTAISLMFLLSLNFTAFAQEVENPSEIVTENEVTIIRVGLFFDSTAIDKQISITTDGEFVLPSGAVLLNSLSANYIEESGTLGIFDADGVMIDNIVNDDSYLITAKCGYIKFNGKTYRNALEISHNAGKIKVINVLPLDHYLYGVLPNEIYPSWGVEALKTTAVAARSFCLASIAGKHDYQGFDVCTNTHCQMYRGMGTEDSRTNKAIDDTAGQVLTYNGKIVNAMYSANNGGYTEGTENVWSAKLPYYIAKPDPYTPEDWWQVTYTATEIEDLLKKSGKDIGNVLDVVIEDRAQSGRVLSLTIMGDKGEYTIKKASVRSFFSLKSSMFTVEKTGNKSQNLINAIRKAQKETGLKLAIDFYTDNECTFLFDGLGFGHGVGISQWGCKNMSDLGKTYEEILDFYYPGTEISQIENI